MLPERGGIPFYLPCGVNDSRIQSIHLKHTHQLTERLLPAFQAPSQASRASGKGSQRCRASLPRAEASQGDTPKCPPAPRRRGPWQAGAISSPPGRKPGSTALPRSRSGPGQRAERGLNTREPRSSTARAATAGASPAARGHSPARAAAPRPQRGWQGPARPSDPTAALTLGPPVPVHLSPPGRGSGAAGPRRPLRLSVRLSVRSSARPARQRRPPRAPPGARRPQRPQRAGARPAERRPPFWVRARLPPGSLRSGSRAAGGAGGNL